MAAMVIVNNPGDWGNVYAPLLHAPWHGWTPTDLIFPFFIFIVGVSITVSTRSAMSVGVLARRAGLIFALGLLLSLYPRFDLSTVRIMGVLQRIALCYFAAALFYRSMRHEDEEERWQSAVGVSALVLLGYWALMRFVPVPGGVAGDLTPAGNLGAWLDRTLLGEAHLWRSSRTWDPEGLLSTLPAVATALTGVAVGVVITGRRTPAEKVAGLVGAAGIAILIAMVWDRSFPINKNLWTSSYVLMTSGMATLGLAACYWMGDARAAGAACATGAPRWFVRPFVVLGVNALFLFVASGVLVKTLIWIHVTGPDGEAITVLRWLYTSLFEPYGSPKNMSLAFAGANLLVLYACCEVLYRKRWFLRV
jgi:predicted acyltransferase